VSKLRAPLKQGLREPADEAALSRIWQGIDARFPRPRWRRRIELLVAAPVVALAAIVFVLTTSRHDPGPLRLASGAPITAVDAPPAGTTLSLSDGSYIVLAGGARLEPLESSRSTFIAIVARGNATFDVRPGGPRRWEIECGLATVEVLGTHFDIERSPGRLRVAVARGQVLVRGERVPDRARRLAAGEALEVVDVTATAPAAPPPAEIPGAGDDPAQEEDQSGSPSPSESERTPAGAWRDLARRGQHREAFATLGAHGLRREARRVGVADLFALADVARLSGHPAEAVAPLDRIVSSFASDPQAPLAAFALGRLELDSLARPARAAAALNKALALGAPQSLREDVRARLVEAYVRAGDQAAARSAADAYRREFPDGRHTRTIRSLLAR
jgi:transmembrane sensor